MNILSGKCLTIIMMAIMITDNKIEDPSELGPQVCRKKKKRRHLRHDSKKEIESLILKEIINYCKKLVTWEEAKPIIDMIEKKVGFDGPPWVLREIQKVKDRFTIKIFGGMIKAEKVNIKKGVFKGPMNNITRNKHVDLSKLKNEDDDDE